MNESVVEEKIVEEKVTASPKTLSGLEKAVICLRHMGLEEIKSIARFLDRTDVEKISRNMTRFDGFDQQDLVRTLSEFRQASTGLFSDSAEDKARFLLEQHEEQVISSSPDGKKRGRLSNLFALQKVSAEKIVALFKNDHNQVLAVVISQLSSTLGKDVIALLEPERRNDVLQRIAMLKEIDQDALQRIDEALKPKMENLLAEGASSNGAYITANILSLFTEEESKVFMDSLKQSQEALFNKINKYYITFSDIMALDNTVLQKILAGIEPQVLAQALCKQPKEVKDKCFTVITKRAVTLIEEEFKSLENAMPIVIQEAQQAIIKNARQLESERKIDLGKK